MAQKTVNSLIQNLLYQPRLSIHEEKELFQKLRKGDVTAGNKLISSHLRFVHHIAKRYKNQGQPIADLIQEGAVGLMEALKRFNPDRGVRLSTYAMWWIRSAIQDYVIRSKSLVKIGTTATQKALFFIIRQRMAERPWEDVFSDEFMQSLAKKFNTSVSEIFNFTRRITRSDQSLNIPIYDDDQITLIDEIVDEKSTPEETLLITNERSVWRKRLMKALSTLPPGELHIIRRRFFTEKVPNRAVLGREIGLSKERVRQLEARALSRLKLLLQPFQEPSSPTNAGNFNKTFKHSV
ncbi:MAG: sigma-70 family RNA polymerase sigma factor [Pseudomonadota bacterium]|nr:sigma-70 family RNA polymerase sigma factor [Pseudomonadota bacterium]